MEEIRCPMCGKSNNAGEETCRHCGARLRPLVVPEPTTPPEPEEGIPEWLAELNETDQKTVQSTPPEEEPAWLNELGVFQPKGEDSESENPQPPAEDSLAELFALQETQPYPSKPKQVAEPSPVSEAAPSTAGEEGGEPPIEAAPQGEEVQSPPLRVDAETAAWLGSLEEAGLAAEPPSEISADQIPEGIEDELPPWYRQMEAEISQPSIRAGQEVVPGWLRSLREEPEASQKPGEPLEAEIPSWLQSFTPPEADELQTPAPDDSAVFPLEQGEEEDLIWLAEDETAEKPAAVPAEGVEETPSTAAAEVPAWLLEMDQESQSEPPSSPIAAEEAETPDWLSQMEGESQPLPEEQAEAETPPWLESLQKADEAELPFTPAEEAETPDWLSQMEGQSRPLPEEQAEAETPPWLESLQKAEEPAVSPFLEEEGKDLAWLMETPSAEEQRDGAPGLGADAADLTWLEPKDEAALSAEPIPFSEEDKISESSTEAAMGVLPGSLPDWLKGDGEMVSAYEQEQEGGSVPEWAASNAALSPEPPAIEEDIPSWLTAGAAAMGKVPPEPQEAKEEEPGEADGEESPPITEAVTAADIQLPPTQVGKSRAQSVEEAQLPEWLSAMRPITGLEAETEAKGEPETTGPLAGLRGTLPGGEIVTPARIPPVYSMRVTLSDIQRSHALLLEQILGEEMRSQVEISQRPRTAPLLGRLLVGLLLILTICIPLFSGSMDTALPDLYPASLVAFFHANDNVNDGEAVLIIVDYPPAFDSELRTIAAPILEHLMLRNARLALVSTDPAGPALGQNLLQQTVFERGVPYVLSDNTINLGYLPGGVTAIRQFVLDAPSAARYAFGSELDRRNPWIHPALSGVTSLSQFSRVILITSQLENARAWIEQTQSVTSGKLFVITSAQTAPLLQPYLESGSVSGMAGGLTDAAMYVQFINKPGAVRLFWDSYQYSTLLIILLILLGAIWQLAAVPLLQKTKRTRRAKA